MNTQDRGQWTSASAAEADSLCHGRHMAQRGIAEPEQSDDAASGTRIHAWLAGQPTQLTDDEMATAKACRDIETAILAKVFPDTVPMVERERRLWTAFHGLLHSGQPDVVVIGRNRVGLVLDYKTGRTHAAESARNMQLRDLAVLAAMEHRLTTVMVAIIQPWATRNPEICTYTQTDLVIALTEMEERVKHSNDPHSKRIAGPVQCLYCRAKGTERCPESLEFAVMPPLKNAPANITPDAIAATLTGEHLAQFLIRAATAEKIIKACRAEARRRIESGDSVPGWKLRPGSVRESVKDVQTCWERASALGVTVQQFMDAVTVKKKDLKDCLKQATGSKGKELDEAMSKLLDGITETSVDECSLVKE